MVDPVENEGHGGDAAEDGVADALRALDVALELLEDFGDFHLFLEVYFGGIGMVVSKLFGKGCCDTSLLW